MITTEILAKSTGESLLTHSLKTLEQAEILVQKSQIEDEYLNDICLISSFFHDIGKCTKNFQNHLLGKEENPLAHNIISYKIFKELIDVSSKSILYTVTTPINAKNIIMKSILLHHPTSNEIEESEDTLDKIEGIEEEDIININNLIDEMINIINPKLKVYQISKKTIPEGIKDDFSYFYGSMGCYEKNSFLNVSNGIVRFADILASNDATMDEYTNFTFDKSKIEFKKPESYDDRFYKHLEYAKQMHDGQIFHLFAPTGYGKTMINVLWALMGDRKVVYVAPTNEIARSNYNSVIKELKSLGLDEIIKVGLLLTNKWEFGEDLNDKNDIIITNIDNYTRPLFKSDKRKSMCFNFNYCNVIFDEYHQYASDSAMMAAFEVALYGRSFCKSSKTIMTTATPNKFLYKKVKHLTKNILVDYKEYGMKKYNCEFRDFDTKKETEDFVMILNSIKASQYKCKEDWINYHTLFTKEDREEIREELNNTHGKKSTKEERKIPVVCTNILSTGIDISFNKMIECGIPMEEIIQITGRCNRWNEYHDGGMLVFSNGYTDKSEKDAIKNKYNIELRDLEHKLLKEKIGNRTITMNELYDIVEEIKNDELYNKKFEDYMTECLKNSYKNLSNLTYNYSHYEVDSDELIITDKPTVRTNGRTRENEVSIFVTVDGCDGYIQIKNFDVDKLRDEHFEYMSKYIKKNKLESKYGYRKEPSKLFKNYLEKSRHSNTPFILNDSIYFYNNKKGLQKYASK